MSAGTASPFRILHIAETLRGGIASYLDEILPAQVARYGHGHISLLAGSSQLQELKDLRGLTIHTYDDSGSRLRKTLALGKALHRLARAESFHVIHAHSTFAGVAQRLVLGWRRQRARLVYCAHGWAFDRAAPALQNRVAAWLEVALSQVTDHIVCISRHDHRSALRAGLPSRRLRLLPNGIASSAGLGSGLNGADSRTNTVFHRHGESRDPVKLLPNSAAKPGSGFRRDDEISEFSADSAFKPVPFGSAPSWPAGAIRVLFVGRFDKQKGIDIFSAALAALGDGWHGCVIGAPVIDTDVPVSFPANITPCGWLPRNQVQHFLASCDVLVVPSRWEGFGLIAIEAMRAGKAVIASRTGGLAEIVMDGVTGCLVTPGSAVELETALRRHDARTLDAMGIAGHARFLACYTSDKLNAGLFALYEGA